MARTWCNSLCVWVAVVVVVVFVPATTKRGTDAAAREGVLYSPLFSQLCVDVNQQQGSPPGEKVHQWDCPEPRQVRRNKLFRFEKVGDAYRIRPDNNRRCLGVKDESTGKGAAVVTQECIDEPHQLWKVTKEGGIPLTPAEETKSPADRRADGNYFQIRAMHTNQCISISGNSKNKGAQMVQFTCKASGNNLDQLWDIQGELGYTSLVSYVPGLKGMWSDVIDLPLVAVAAANLPDGRILSWASFTKSGFEGGTGQTVTSIYDPDTTMSSEMTVEDTQHDMFCPGTSVLFDGRVYITGGADLSRTTFYDPKTNIWSVGPELNEPRGYHGQTVLADGSVFLLGGSFVPDDLLGGKYGEVWNPKTNVWTGRTNIHADGTVVTDDRLGIYRADNHMWLYLAPNGLIFHAGPSKHMHWMDVWSTPDGSVIPAGQRSSTDRMNGCSVMYDIGKILTFGGSADYEKGNATAEAFVIDLNNGTSATVSQTGSLHFPRVLGNAVVLPNGHVLAFGGQSHSVLFHDDLAQYRVELWKPETGEWELLENAAVPRNYHSVALLMQNGKVWSAGGGLCGTLNKCKANHLDAQVFTPPYLLDTATGMPKVQPLILEAPTVIWAGSVFTVKMDSETDHTFALCRLSAVTHSVDNDSRRIPLTVVSQSGSFTTLSVPSSIYISLAGTYHLFGMNPDGVPSIGHVLYLHPPEERTGVPTTAPHHPTLAGGSHNPSFSPTVPPTLGPTEAPQPDGGGNKEGPRPLSANPATPFSPFSIYRINAGGPSGTVHELFWETDDEFRSGACKGGNFGNSQTSGMLPFDAQFLHQQERWGPCTFTMPVASGNYAVVLHLVEHFHKNQQVGARVFDIDVQNGQVTYENVDIFAAVGAAAVYYLTANVTVGSGEDLVVELKKGAIENPKISALEVIPLPTITPPTSAPILPPTSAPILPPTLAPSPALTPSLTKAPEGPSFSDNPTFSPTAAADPTFAPTLMPMPNPVTYPMFVGMGPIVSMFGSQKCLDRDTRGSGVNMHQWACHYRANQQFELWRHEDGKYTIFLKNTSYCLSVKNASTAKAGTVVAELCANAPHQLWTISGSGDARDLRVMHTGYCLALAGNNQQKQLNGANVIQFPCDDPLTPQMKWKVAALDP